MPQRRSISPSPDALRMRHRRAAARADRKQSESGPQPLVPGSAPGSPATGPAVADDAALDEALRVRAIHDARRSFELAEQQRIATEVQRGVLILKSVHRESVAIIVSQILSHIGALVDTAVRLHPPTEQPAARHKLNQAVLTLREAARLTIRGGQ